MLKVQPSSVAPGNGNQPDVGKSVQGQRNVQSAQKEREMMNRYTDEALELVMHAAMDALMPTVGEPMSTASRSELAMMVGRPADMVERAMDRAIAQGLAIKYGNGHYELRRTSACAAPEVPAAKSRKPADDDGPRNGGMPAGRLVAGSARDRILRLFAGDPSALMTPREVSDALGVRLSTCRDALTYSQTRGELFVVRKVLKKASLLAYSAVDPNKVHNSGVASGRHSRSPA